MNSVVGVGVEWIEVERQSWQQERLHHKGSVGASWRQKMLHNNLTVVAWQQERLHNNSTVAVQ